MAKKPVSLRMHPKVHQLAKRRAKQLGMKSLADYIEALVEHDTAHGYDIQVTYSETGRQIRAIPSKRKAAKKQTTAGLTDSVGLMKKSTTKKRAAKTKRRQV